MTAITENIIKRSTRLRHQLHSMAELSDNEERTARHIISFLDECDPDSIINQLGGEGLVATFEGSGEGPDLMLRCELDALPIPEENDLDYASETANVAHKCGHDGHMAMVAGVAAYLSEHRPENGNVHLLFQPAEETGQGAARVLNDQRFTDISPDYIFALHNLPGYKKNQIVVRDGVFAAASRGFEVELKGDTSHAAHPENGRSPALALSALIQNFSAFPQFYSSLDDVAKVTVIQSKLGEVAFGTSPGYAEFRATIRTYRNALMENFCERAEQMVQNIANTYDLESNSRWTELFEATKCDPECNEMIRKAASAGGFEIHQKEKPFAWSEDFGRFTSNYKGAIFGLGAGEDQPQLHSTIYDFPDEVIPTGVAVFVDIIKQITGVKQEEA